MTRARFVLGSEDFQPEPILTQGQEIAKAQDGQHLRERFDAVREAVITAPRDAAALRDEIASMRERVRAAHPVRGGLFDVKHSPGGMVDVEFVIQYLVLSRSGQYRELIPNLGNITLLQHAEAAGLLAPGVGVNAAKAYRELRRLQHVARLDERSAQLKPDQAQTERAAVLSLWHSVFSEPAA